MDFNNQYLFQPKLIKSPCPNTQCTNLHLHVPINKSWPRNQIACNQLNVRLQAPAHLAYYYTANPVI